MWMCMLGLAILQADIRACLPPFPCALVRSRANYGFMGLSHLPAQVLVIEHTRGLDATALDCHPL